MRNQQNLSYSCRCSPFGYQNCNITCGIVGNDSNQTF